MPLEGEEGYNLSPEINGFSQFTADKKADSVEIDRAVYQARCNGMTFAEVGKLFGFSAGRAAQRYKRYLSRTT
jgi:hypothetical protein